MTDTLPFWRICRELILALYGLFGDPTEIAASGRVTKDFHRICVAWLRAGEEILRRLITIEAAALELTPLPPTPKRAPRITARAAIAFDPCNPDTWRAPFAYLPRRPSTARKSARRARWDMPRGFYPALPLARRFVALVRVFNDPASYARRALRRMQRRMVFIRFDGVPSNAHYAELINALAPLSRQSMGLLYARYRDD